MGLSEPRSIFGVHSITARNRTTGKFYGIAKCLAGSTFSLEGETVKLEGGSSKYPWAVADGKISASLSIAMKEYPDWLFEVFLGKKPTINAVEASGSVTTPINKVGTSAINATTGIASIGVKSGSEADVKFNEYTIEVISATTVMITAATDVDFARGTDKTFENDDLEILSAAITIPDSGATVDVPGFGLEITGGSGTVAMTIGDTSTFESRPINASSMEVSVGGSSDIYPEFEAILVAEYQGKIFSINVHKLKCIGAPIGMTAKEWSEGEVTAEAAYDSAKNAVFKATEILF